MTGAWPSRGTRPRLPASSNPGLRRDDLLLVAAAPQVACTPWLLSIAGGVWRGHGDAGSRVRASARDDRICLFAAEQRTIASANGALVRSAVGRARAHFRFHRLGLLLGALAFNGKHNSEARSGAPAFVWPAVRPPARWPAQPVPHSGCTWPRCRTTPTATTRSRRCDRS